MPRPRIPEYWREMVKTKLAQNERISVAQLRRELVKQTQEMGKSDDLEFRALAAEVPSERTIARIKDEEWAPLPDSERAQYREFHWPESMERGDLPWEAGAAGLELLAHLHSKEYGRPSVRSARWFWRVTLAAPDAPIEERVYFALWLSKFEAGSASLKAHLPEAYQVQMEIMRAIEWHLAYSSWRSEEACELYEKALQRKSGEFDWCEAIPTLDVLADKNGVVRWPPVGNEVRRRQPPIEAPSKSRAVKDMEAPDLEAELRNKRREIARRRRKEIHNG